MKRKCLAVGIILLFVGICIIPVIAQDTAKPITPTSRGNWLYVGGTGPGNYTRIQDAINHSSDGDTVFVYDDSSPYNESIYVKKSIILQGENWDTTIIQRGSFYIIVNNVTVTSFIIKNGSGIIIQNSSNDIIENCDVYDNWYGLQISDESGNNRIRNCSFHRNYVNNALINALNSSGTQELNEISYCDFYDCGPGSVMWAIPGSVVFFGSHNNAKIHHCNIINNPLSPGIMLYSSAAQINSNNIMNNSNDDGDGGVVFCWWLFHFSNIGDNWWGSPRGPSINIMTRLGSVSIRKVDQGDNVVFYGFFVPKMKEILSLYPWRTEPVADAGRHT
jgi:parallel beta-helix repeat protein